MSIEAVAKKDIKMKVDEQTLLKVLRLNDVSESYVGWLNDSEVNKFTEQKFFRHTLESVKTFVS